MSHSLTVRAEDWMFFEQDSAHRPSQTPEHFEALRSGRQHRGNVRWAKVLRHTTRHDSQDPPAWLTVVCLDSVFSLEFPSVECFSTFYSSWFIPTDWSVRAEGENIMFYSNHYDSFKQWTPRLHCRCIPCLHPSPFSRLKRYLPAFYSNAFCSSASTDKGSWSSRIKICTSPRSLLSIEALNDSSQLFSLHSRDWSDEFYHSLRFNNQPPSPSKFLFPFPAPG